LHVISDIRGPRRDHRLVFRVHLALGALGLIGASTAVATAGASVHHDPRGAHDVVILRGHFTYPAVNAAAAVLLVLAGLGLAVVTILVLACWRQLRAYRHFVGDVRVLGPLPGHPDVTVIADQTPQAFCAGYLRPRIYVSAGALELLASDELAAVVLHEKHHLSARDPLRLGCARVLSEALFFLPALRPLSDRYSELAEQRADEAAILAAGGATAPLASALLAFEAGAPGGSAGISPERVDSLLGKSTRRQLPTGLIGLSLAAVSLLIVLVWRASAVASADATFNLPLVSSQPCMLVLALLPVVICLVSIGSRRLLRTPGAVAA
jgi:Zn-dependent protease with chaperone function